MFPLFKQENDNWHERVLKRKFYSGMSTGNLSSQKYRQFSTAGITNNKYVTLVYTRMYNIRLDIWTIRIIFVHCCILLSTRDSGGDIALHMCVCHTFS